MNMRHFRKPFLAAALAAATLMSASQGQAQLASGGEGGPIMFSADNMQADNADHTVVLDGRVQLLQDNARFQADYVKIFYTQSSTGERDQVSRIEARGKIYYVVDDQVMRGDQAVYTRADDTMIMTGDVILKQGQNVLTGNRLTYVVGPKRSTLDGAPASSSRGRVRGVFYPEGTPAPTQP